MVMAAKGFGIGFHFSKRKLWKTRLPGGSPHLPKSQQQCRHSLISLGEECGLRFCGNCAIASEAVLLFLLSLRN